MKVWIVTTYDKGRPVVTAWANEQAAMDFADHVKDKADKVEVKQQTVYPRFPKVPG